MKKPSIPLVLFTGAALTAILFALLRALPPLIPCFDTTAQSLGLALCIGLGLSLLAGARLLGDWRVRWALAVEMALLLLTAWLGFYPVSPLFTSGRIPILTGFTVVTRARGALNLPPGGMVTLVNGSPATVRPLTVLDGVRCSWMSTFNGVLDDPQSCATVYVPPKRDYDILKVSLQPGCGLPRSVGQTKISILP